MNSDNTFTFTINEQLQLAQNRKLFNYYRSNFFTDYPIASVTLPLGRTISNTLVYDNWINKTVNRYASASIGKYASLEIDDETTQASITNWHEAISFEGKLTSIARYQGLYGYAVVKLLLKHDRDSEGEVVVAGKTADEMLEGFDIAVFGGDRAMVRYNDYGTVDSIIINLGKTIEVFYDNRLEVYEANPAGTHILTRVDPNPVAPMPLAFVINNLETAGNTASDVENIITLQESLNDALTSLRLVNHYHGFPIYTATGVEIATDDNGNPRPLVMGAGMTLQSESSDTSFGRVEMPAITPLKESIEALTREIAVSTNSLSLLTGQIPSGQALAHMLSEFNAAVTEKQSKLKAFIIKFHRTVLKLLDYMLSTNLASIKLKAYVGGYTPIADEVKYQQSKELYTLGLISKRTMLDNSEIIESTSDELERLALEAATQPQTTLSSLLG